MKYFAGLDVSLEETAICVVDETGRIVKELRAASEPEALVAALQETGLVLERIGLEACSLTAWLHEGLTQAGLPAICIETRQANAAMKTMPNKTDRNDARALAQIMRTGWFRQVQSRAGNAACGAHFWSRAGRSSTRCGLSKTWCVRFCAKPESSSAHHAEPLSPIASGKWLAATLP
jgi:predicted NBD/HSP70 family sugar kinase